MNLRKAIAYAMIGGMAVSSLQIGVVNNKIPYVCAATEDYTVNQSKEMEKILTIVKERIDIPSYFKKFDCSYNEWAEEPCWGFYWTTEEDNEYIRIQADKNAHIISYERYGNSNDHSRVAKYQKKKMKDKAYLFLRKVEPDLYSHMELIHSDYTNSYSNSYKFIYQRKENHTPVPENYVTIQVNAATGEVYSYRSNWVSKAKFLNPEKMITKDEAKAVLKSELNMNLEYHLVEKKSGEGYVGELVYAPNKTYLAVDAGNKKVYDTRDSIGKGYSNYDQMEEAKDASTTMASDSTRLTEQEIKEIDEVAGLLTKSQAEKKVKNNGKFLLPPNAKKVTTSLYKRVLDSSNPKEKTYVYRMQFSSKNEEEYLSTAYAEVDAKTGEVYRFSSSPDYDRYSDSFATKEIRYTKEDGQKLVESFLKEYYEEYYKNLKFKESSDGYALFYNMDYVGDHKYGGCDYIYSRLEDGVPVTYNTFRVSIDLVTGKVYDFSYNWNENVMFEKKDKVITPEEAQENYLSNEEFKKVYEILPKEKESDKYYPTRLVYRTNIEPAYIDAISGKQVYLNADEVTKKSEIKYNDIAGTTYEKTIQLLADMNIGFTDGKFQPKKKMTILDWNNFVKQMYNSYTPEFVTMKGIGTITREDAVKCIISAYGLSKIAEYDIYKSNYKDEKKVTKGNLGYLVLAEKMGLIKTDKDGNIRPKEEITREEAANLFMIMISTTSF